MLKKYIIGKLKRFKLLRHLNLEVQSEYAGRNYIIPIMNDIGVKHLYTKTEPWMKESIIKLLKLKNGIFVDVGVNIGQTLMKVRSASTVPYVGIEINPECVVYVKKLIELNKLKDCIVCPVGLSNKNGLTTLYSNFTASPYATTIEGFRDHRNWDMSQIHIVPVMRGDDLFPDLFRKEEKDIAVIKIDVEGAELEAIEGIEGTMKKYRPFIITEILPAYSPNEPHRDFKKERQDRLVSLIKNRGYSFFKIVRKEGVNSYEFVSQPDVERKTIGGGFNNYVLVPTEGEKEFQSIS
jgi:FkbM family methyltransferase